MTTDGMFALVLFRVHQFEDYRREIKLLSGVSFDYRGGGGGGEGISLGVNPFLDKKIITDGRKNHLCQTFREMLEEEKEGEKEEAK